MRRIISVLAMTLLLPACEKAIAPTADPGGNNIIEPAEQVSPIEEEGHATNDVAALSGRWANLAGHYAGPDGMVAEVASRGEGKFTLTMQYDPDNKGTFDGRADEHGIRFDRNGESLVLKPSDGASTGLKALAGKKDCVMVREGEGYCRD